MASFPSMPDFPEPARPGAPIILDGAMGTELGFRGASLVGLPWSASAMEARPELVEQVHAAYARAGAIVHTANTFRTQPQVQGATFRVALTHAVALARAAVPSGQWIMGSMAPVNDCYRPDLAPEEHLATEAHETMATALHDVGVDGVLCETFASPGEAVIATRAARKSNLRVWTALTAGPEATLLSPRDLAAAAERCAYEGAALVLANCIDFRRTLPFAEALAATGVPFGIYANAGVSDSGTFGPATSEDVADYARAAERWLRAGARVLGGCCGTGPRHIELLASL